MTENLLHELLDRAFLFEDPATYRAGVVDAWSAIRDAVATAEAPVDGEAAALA